MNNFVFFGSATISELVLKRLTETGHIPRLVITNPDRRQGRGMKMTANPLKLYAIENNIEVKTPDKLDDTFLNEIGNSKYEYFLVAGYGKILPKNLLSQPRKGSLNIHPSALPKYRGPSPIETAILNADELSACALMLMDEKMDHGPVLAQVPCDLRRGKDIATAKNRLEVTRDMAILGADLFSQNVTDFLIGNLKPSPQDESLATYTKKISKSDGLIDLNDDPKVNFLKYKAYEGWPKTYFYRPAGTGHGKIAQERIIITEATYENGCFRILKVIPEGGKEISYREIGK